MPVANTSFNMTEVGYGHDYYEYEKAMDSLFKPHNVTPFSFRTPTASWRGTAITVTAGTSSARTS